MTESSVNRQKRQKNASNRSSIQRCLVRQKLTEGIKVQGSGGAAPRKIFEDTHSTLAKKPPDPMFAGVKVEVLTIL